MKRGLRLEQRMLLRKTNILPCTLWAGLIVEGDTNNSNSVRLYGIWACYFEELIAVDVEKTKALINWTKIIELDEADDHTLIKYYRKRIPCSCLDEKYKEVKSVKKMGWCCNPNCSVRKIERRKMFCCTQCGEVNYCSIECQKEDWKDHRGWCVEFAEVKAAFNSKQS